jgi:hypothetical protein
MKCVCGYEHETQWNKEQKYNETIVGDESFKICESQLSFKDDEDYFVPSSMRSIYACPKCGTLKIDI